MPGLLGFLSWNVSNWFNPVQLPLFLSLIYLLVNLFALWFIWLFVWLLITHCLLLIVCCSLFVYLPVHNPLCLVPAPRYAITSATRGKWHGLSMTHPLIYHTSPSAHDALHATLLICLHAHLFFHSLTLGPCYTLRLWHFILHFNITTKGSVSSWALIQYNAIQHQSCSRGNEYWIVLVNNQINHRANKLTSR